MAQSTDQTRAPARAFVAATDAHAVLTIAFGGGRGDGTATAPHGRVVESPTNGDAAALAG